MTGDLSLSATQIMAAASETLALGGYRRAERALGSEWSVETARLFEDPSSVVAVIVLPTWAELKGRWAEAQASLVSLMAQSISSADPKAWDGYLILLTPSTAGADRATLDSIRRDTTKVRKLVGTGDDLQHVKDVEQIVGLLLPLDSVQPESSAPEDPLDSLHSLPSMRGVSQIALREVVEAFRRQEPMLDRLHRSGASQ